MAIRISITGRRLLSFHHLPKPSLSTTIRPLSIIPEDNLLPLSTVFHRYGFSPQFLEKNSFLLRSIPSDIDKSFKILHSLIPCQDSVVSIVYDVPSVLELEFLVKWEKGILDWREMIELSPLAIRKILEVGRRFGSSPDDVLRCVECLRGLGFGGKTVVRVLEDVPSVVMSNEDEIRRKVGFLMGFGICRTEISRVFSLFPGIMKFGVENRLKPLLDEFADLGFSLSEVRREVLREPMVLGLEIGELTHCLEMLRSLKCRAAIKEDIFWHGEFRAAYNVKLRVDCLRKHGLIYRDAFGVVWKEPRIILYDLEDVEKKIEFLVREMKYDIQCLVEVPEYLGVNLDKQIFPRFRVIEYLRSNGALGDEVDLRTLIKLSRLRFYNMYVKPYPECEEMYGRYVRGSKVQSRHPVGMWKMFRPQQHPKSDEDVKNIRSYMQSLP